MPISSKYVPTILISSMITVEVLAHIEARRKLRQSDKANRHFIGLAQYLTDIMIRNEVVCDEFDQIVLTDFKRGI